MALKGKMSCWKYLLQPENTSTPARCRIMEACKTCLWLGVSILVGMGMGQLS